MSRMLVLLSLVALTSCSPTRSSMISYDSLRSNREARFFVHDDTIVMRFHDPMGLALVIYEPALEGDRVVLNGGLASAGSGGERTHCVVLSSPPPGWQERLFWREPDGELTRITEFERGLTADELTSLCRAWD